LTKSAIAQESTTLEPLPINGAITALRSAANQRGADERFHQRVLEMQTLLAEDLAEVEEALAEVAMDGTAPATLAARHLVGLGGKRARPMSLLLSTACFGPIPPWARELAVVSELIHSATLLHDDVIDEGMERRGAATARRLWGNAMSVIAGDLLLVHGLERTLHYGPEAMPDLLEALRQLVNGEVVQLRCRTELDLSEETYHRVVLDKTASLFVWATRTGARLGGASSADQTRMGEFGKHLGLAFQLVDDVLDYVGEGTGKTLLADLKEGKATLPLVLAAQRMPILVDWVSCLHAGEAVSMEEISRAVVESGACDEVRLRATRTTEQALEALGPIPASPARLLLEQFACELAQRVA
jgi:octaprenyl-diphosphate synthase